MSKNKWLKPNDYVDNMLLGSKICWDLKILKYEKQWFGRDKTYVGVFQFNFKNPLTLLPILLIYIACLFSYLWTAIVIPIKETKEFMNEGVLIEINENYKTK